MPEQKDYRKEVYRYVKRKYRSEAEYLWDRYPAYAVFRHQDNRKWYGLVMDVPRVKLGLPGDGIADVLNVKIGDELLCDLMTQQDGYLPGYHISRGGWISVLLDGTVPLKGIKDLIDRSYLVTASKQTRNALRPPKEWIIPSNPRYYDVIRAFEEEDVINWKQGKNIKTGDIIYLYVGAPYSAILYQCRVEETELPYTGRNPNVNIQSLMRIRRMKKYPPDRFPFERLKNDYDIFAVRGPRGIPEQLSEDLKR